MLHIAIAFYFFARLFFVQPLIPPLPSPPSSSLLKPLAFCLCPVPLLFFAPTSTVFLSYAAASVVALRFAYHHPYSLDHVSFWRCLLWRADVLLYSLFLLTQIFAFNNFLLLKAFVILIAFSALSTFVLNLLESANSESMATNSESAPTIINLIRLAFSQKAPNIDSFATVPPTVHNASVFVLLSFQWVSPILHSASSRPLQHDDISNVTQAFGSESTSKIFQSTWRQEQQQLPAQSSSPSLLRALRRSFGLRIFITGIPKLFSDTMSLLAPIVLRKIIQYLQSDPTRARITVEGCILALLLLFINISGIVLIQQYYLYIHVARTMLHGALVHSVFQKTTRLSPFARSEYESGQIQNMMSTDCRTVSSFVTNIHELWASVFQVCVSLGLLVQLLGFVPALATFALVLCCIPLEARLLSMTTALRKSLSRMTDERVNAISEVIKGIKLIKLYAWEVPFIRRIERSRFRELRLLRSVLFLQVWNFLLTSSLSTTLTVVAFAIYVLLGHVLDAALVFPAIALFDIMWPALLFFPNIITGLGKALASLKRLEKYLLAEELNKRGANNNSEIEANLETKRLEYVFEDAVLKWTSSQNSFSLSTKKFSIPDGALVAVVGSTAGGKSTLLAGMLGELAVSSGQIYSRIERSVSYCDQVPFIQNATVRGNILFGKAYDKKLYEKVLSVCCLLPDLRTLPAGEMTEIGSRGVNLSGGQRARVALARAVYANSDICLMDDPLSAVDANVGKHIFEECIVSQLPGKTRVFTTNHLHIASSSKVDLIVVVTGGSVVEAGRRADLMSDPNSRFRQLLSLSGITTAARRSDETLTKAETDPSSFSHTIEDDQEGGSPSPLGYPADNSKSTTEGTNLLKRGSGIDYGALESGRLTKAESKNEGHVKLSHYKTYILSMGLVRWVLPIATLGVLDQIMRTCFEVWLSVWSEKNSSDSLVQNLSIFFLLGVSSVILGGMSMFALACGSLQASTILHQRLVMSVLGAPISFFNSTPEGRLMNRFNNDIDRVDSELAYILENLFTLLLVIIIRYAMLTWAIPWFVFVIVPVVILLWFIQGFYRRGVVDLKRLEALSYSPLYSHFAETIDGVVTIRAFNDVERVVKMNEIHTDLMLKTSFAITYARRWLSMRMNTSGSILTFATTVVLMNTPSSRISTSMKALLLTYMVSLVNIIRWSVKGLTELESRLSSIERISEYSNDSFPRELTDLETTFESNSDNENKRVVSSEEGSPFLFDSEVHISSTKDVNWPRHGRITFSDVRMRYRSDLELALKSVSFSVYSGEHFAIIGRTGAGKTSTIQSLFRLYELAGGRITIDGVDISCLRLQDLRSKIGVIPQEAICFSGTIRANLDMLNMYSDEEVQRAFNLCGLAESTNVGLDFEVGEGGANLSVGQRQMMCLGRALLRRCQVVVLDEATSSVSAEVDNRIQRIIRKEMKGCTMLTVAHRLGTVMGNDRVMIMDHGRVAEIGRPSELLRKDSLLKKLVDETGEESAVYLRRLAGMHDI